MGLGTLLPPSDEVDAGPEDSNPRPELLVSTLQELGTVYVKFGQVLATRRDLLPPEYCDALATLTDSTPTTPVDEIKQVIRDEFDEDPGTLFPTFGDKPLGSASVGQVHPVVLADERAAVVKVRKPGVVQLVEDDLALLGDLVHTLERHSRQIKEFGFVEVYDVFAKSLRAEVDLTTEARACDAMADKFADDPTVHIPWIEQSLTTSQVVTQERVSGLRLDDADALVAAGLGPAAVAHTYLDALMRMVFEFGTFHADPHAGNVVVAPDGTLTFIDWGMVGLLGSREQDRLMRLVAAFASGNDTLLLSALLNLAPPRARIDKERLRTDVSAIAASLRSERVDQIPMGDMAEDLLATSLDRLETMSNRLVTGMVVSAGMIASTLLVLARRSRRRPPPDR
ncbi:ABC1 kinase family protein [Aestuariimicrobium sp. Y1814]|uniref:ABC1 kinase family protein n=1 Tax=Aestuariimicrobium sp. Y1814 TaxID=3418742 RepID=UPI003DA750E5